MTRLPIVGSDTSAWGTILNQFLQAGHNAIGTNSNSMTVYNVRDDAYAGGAKVDGATDDTAALAAAMAAAHTAGGGVVSGFNGGTCISGNQTLYSNVILDLQGGVIKLKNGANTDLFSAQTGSINLSASFAAGSAGTLCNFAIRNGTLDGNKANQSGGPSYPLRFYGYNFLLQNLSVKNGYSGGILCDWNGGGIPAPDSMESQLLNIRIHDCGGIGLQMGGPHDSRLTGVTSYSNASHGFHFAPNMLGVLCTNIHPYSLTQSVSAVGCLCEAGSAAFVNCMFEGSDYVQFVALANDISILGGQIFGNVGYAGEGLRLGQPSGQTPIPGQINQSAGSTTAVSASGCNINTKFVNNTGGAINFWNESLNTVIAHIFQTSGGVLVSSRAPANTDTIWCNVNGLTTDHTINTTSAFRMASSNSQALLVKNASGNDIFDVNAQVPSVSLVNGSGFNVYTDAYSTNVFSIDGSTGAMNGAGTWTVVGKAGFGPGGFNAGISVLISTDDDARPCLVMYPHSSSQSVPLFKVQNSSFADVFTVDKNGAAKINGGATFYSGSGAPSGGNNGDYYFRTDTPGTANQRIYIKSSGSWTGIV